jgi:hypothetical protein
MEGTTLAAPHRVDACSALHEACIDAGGSCPPMPCLTRQAPPLTQLESELAELEPYPAIPLSLELDDDSMCDVGGSSVTVHVSAGQTAACDALALGPATELVNPTPESIGCPTCTIQDGAMLEAGVLSLSTHEYYERIANERVLVSLKDGDGLMHRYDLGQLDLTSQSHMSITLSPVPSVVRSGEIAIDFGTVTTVDPLLVL